MIKDTVVYKLVGGCAIRLDVVRSARSSKLAPVVVWLHGGALIFGDRNALETRAGFRDLLLGSGFAVVAADYRLAPETRLPEILEDLKGVFAWIADKGSEFGLDRSRVGVIGHSAGGYLALMSAFSIVAAPRAVVSFYGYGDIAGPWYSKPSPHYCKEPLVSEGEARSCIGSVAISEPPESNCRQRFYLYLRQRGLWPNAVAGLDPSKRLDAFRQWCPALNVSANWPPVLLIHGTSDTDVPFERSADMAHALSFSGVPNRLITIPNGIHGFDRDMTPEEMERRPRSPAAEACFDAVQFLVRHVR